MTVAARLIADIEDGSWFAAVGEPPTEGESAEALALLAGLGLGATPLAWSAGWDAARAAAQREDWDRAWWEAEQAEQRRLYASAAAALGEQALLRALTEVTDAATRLLHGPAAVAAARAGIADSGLVRVAAGAASQACYQAALARLAGGGPEHPFEAKFRLFLAGRWPLTVAGGKFHVF